MFKATIFTLVLFISTTSFSQRKDGHAFGELLNAEKELTIYAKDSTANAVVLYERGDNYFEIIDDRIKMVKDYHVKIKILNKKAFDEGTISIFYYHNKDASESVNKIEAITHNGSVKTSLKQSNIYTKDVSERWEEKTFTFPNIKEGSILEYKYKYISPYFFNFKGWEFQSNIPKIHSEFNAKIPANYVYNRSLKGSITLNVNEADIEKHCFHVPGYPDDADCEILKYIMKDVPAFNEEEEYMLAASNYRSAIEFELSQHYRLDGSVKKYTKSWETVDKQFRSDKDFGRQLSKKNFFEKNVPTDLLKIEQDTLATAKGIYAFVKKHFSWNGKHSTYGKARVKNAFNEKTGNAWEINMSLINLLNAAGIKTKMMLISTRTNGLPKTNHPIMSDFNYILARTKINGKIYLLDGTNKFNPFGSLPFKSLNHYGRVMDAKKDSYWEKIIPKHGSRTSIMGVVKFDSVTKKAKGTFRLANIGYKAIAINKKRDELSKDTYLVAFEEQLNEDIQVTDYTYNSEKSDALKVIEKFEFDLESPDNSDIRYLNPFLIKFFKQNPFLSDKRNFPVDFGYKRRYSFKINIAIPSGYSLEGVPESQSIKLGDNLATLRLISKKIGTTISLSFDLSLNETHFASDDYEALKSVFKHVTEIQNNTLLVFKKNK